MSDHPIFKLHVLSQTFYDDFPRERFPEILTKPQRPYIFFEVTIDGIQYAIPFRSSIAHQHAFFTDDSARKGLDYTKSVVITTREYIDVSKVQIEQKQFDVLKINATLVQDKFQKYLKKYKRAALRQDVPRNQIFCQFSALKYFHTEMGIEIEPLL